MNRARYLTVNAGIAGAAVVALLLALLAGCGGEQGEDSGSTVLARVGPYRITEADLERRIAAAQLPQSARSVLATPEGKTRFLQGLVEEKLLVLAAEASGADRDPEARARIGDLRDQFLASYYSQTVLLPLSKPDSADVERYYQENLETYQVPERVQARQIVVAERGEAERIRDRLRAGDPFNELVGQSIDESTRNLEGALGYISPGQPVRGLGLNEEFVTAVLEVPAGEVSDPIKTEKGFHIVKVEIHEPARVRPLESVSDAIRRRLVPQKFNELAGHLVDSLSALYAVEIDSTSLYEGSVSGEDHAKELFDQAQNAEDAAERVRLYQEIVDRYGDSKYGAQAQFMIGFIYAEDLGMKEQARVAFKRVIDRYSSSELVDSARYMLENMDSPSIDSLVPGPRNEDGQLHPLPFDESKPVSEPGGRGSSEAESGSAGGD